MQSVEFESRGRVVMGEWMKVMLGACSFVAFFRARFIICFLLGGCVCKLLV